MQLSFRMNSIFIAMILLIILIQNTISFKLSSSISRSSPISLKSLLSMELQLKYVKIPIQSDSRKYEEILKTQIPENQIIR